MAKMIFVNLPVKDVEKAAAFYRAIGATQNKSFSQKGVAAAITFSDNIHFMLLSHERFSDFTKKRIIDGHTEVGALLCLSADSREEVDATIAQAVAAGGKGDTSHVDEMGDFMYGRDFQDLDGHNIEVMWMDLERMMAQGGGLGEEGEGK